MILGIAADGRIDFCAGSSEDLCGRTAEDLLGRTLALEPGPRLRLRFGRGAEDIEDAADTAAHSLLSWSDLTLGEEQEADLVCDDGSTRLVALRIDRRVPSVGEAPPAYVVAVGRVDPRMADLMATASHELRTPVTSILGYSELLRASPEGVLPATSLQLLGRIDRNARRLRGLIEDMLTLSQVEAGGFRLELERLDLRVPLERAIGEVRSVLPVRELGLRTRISPSPVMVMGDSDRLERAFSQLLDNAVKFSLVGETIDVTLSSDDRDAVVTVEDRGVGIEPEEQRRVFERFYRGSRAHELVTQGSGMGLAVTQAVLVGHGGSVEVESEPGRGSCFTVRVPLSR